ncbi:glycosyl transferase family 28 protein [Rubinisphaera margarita]|uniref:glycosyl transferase family 28 protein n=1 Tax=Rubinisphaera margarita TaxID=2909586 RepID=UPI001EE9211C|nr:glycosyl transferase family 28 protein [Rubinisphaera margarita]MCG6158196.1 glycosyl transferase family 28 protein [Rubinisphaera margarita]
MTFPLIGYYTHYHGFGHQRRAEAILAHVRNPAWVISSRMNPRDWCVPPGTQFLDLPCDDEDLLEEGLTRSGDVPGVHYVPLWAPNCRQRIADYTAWMATERPSLVVVDVSVEISLLTRMATIPQIVMRQHGQRDDDAHENAYHAAERLLAPFPEMLEDDITPEWVRQKTLYLGGFARSVAPVSRVEARDQLQLSNEERVVVVMTGRGGHARTPSQIVEAARATQDWQWHVIGGIEEHDADSSPDNVTWHGWVSNPEVYINACDVLVTAAGHNSVMEAGRDRVRMIAIPEDRPFREQERKVAVLDREQLAIGQTQWPEPQHWPALLEQAMQLDLSRWDAVFNGNGAEQAARLIEEIADWSADRFQQIDQPASGVMA